MHSDLFPAPYGRWLVGLLGDPSPEPVDCAACPQVDGPLGFAEATGCCTFQPRIPSFQAGFILRGARADVVRAAIEAGQGTPTGLEPPSEWTALWQAERGERFGRDETQRCPYLQPGRRCGIYARRPVSCATWSCRHRRGGVGRAAWEDAHALLAAVERGLTSRFAEDYAGEDLEAWYGRCADRVEGMDWSDVQQIVDVDPAAARAALEALAQPTLPPRLAGGSLRILQGDGTTLTVAGHSALDPVALPTDALPWLSRFKDADVDVVVEKARAAGVPLSDALLLALVDRGILRGR